MLKFTVYKNFNKIVEQPTHEDMFQRIKLGVYGYEVDPCRKALKDGNTELFERLKKQLYGFTSMAWFLNNRKQDNPAGYNQLALLDVDHLSDDQLPRIKKIICECKYTWCCFVSPSGSGLKVFVRISTGLKDHLRAWLSVQHFYSVLTGVTIDPSGKDISRLCFVSKDPDLYFNGDSIVFTPILDHSPVWPSPVHTEPVKKPEFPEENTMEKSQIAPPVKISTRKTNLGPEERYQRCVTLVERTLTFIEGQRNKFVFSLAGRLHRAGFDEQMTLFMLMRDYGYNEKEVRQCVKSAFSYNSANDPPPINVNQPTAPPDNLRTANDNAFVEGITDDYPDDIKKDSEDKNGTKKPAKGKKAASENGSSSGSSGGGGYGHENYDLGQTKELINARYKLHYNMVLGVIEWKLKTAKAGFKRMTDYDENSILCFLHDAGQKIPQGLLHALLVSDFSPEFNPFLDYFKYLKIWDGVTDYIGQLCDTVKTEDDEYFRFCFRKWFVAFVASLVEDKIINHTVIVLSGAQASGKTSWMKTLVPSQLKNYLGTAIMQSDSKDTAIQLSECALILLDELENLNRKDLAAFKELITRPEIRIRRPYGRLSENLPHRASFVAAVNFDQVLTDPSGTRRYLCSKVISIDYQHKVDIDQCMAQAYTLYQQGFIFWFNQDEIRILNHRNESFLSKSVEEELVETWFRPVTFEEWKSRDQISGKQVVKLMTATEIAAYMMQKAHIMLMDSTVIKIGKILKKKGFIRVRKGDFFTYMVRIMDVEDVDMNNRTLEDLESHKSELNANNQNNINLPDDNAVNESDYLPF